MKKKILTIILSAFIMLSFLPTNVMAETNFPIDTIKAHRDKNDENMYFLTSRDTSNLNIGDEIAWLDSSYTEGMYTLVGVPENAGIVKLVNKPDPAYSKHWEAYYPEQVNFYLDVIKSGEGFDGCPHGTLNHNVTEYNCYAGGVQHLKGKAYTYVEKPFYSKVTINLNYNGIKASNKKVELFDGKSFFSLTDKGEGVYSSNTIYIGNYSIYVDREPLNMSVNVIKTPAEDGYLCDIGDNGQYIKNDDISKATAYYSGHEYVVNGNFYDYDISVKYNGVSSDDLGLMYLVANNTVYNLSKTATGTYTGTINLPMDISSENINIYVGNSKTDAVFQTVSPGESNKNIEINFYTAKAKVLLDKAPMSGCTVSFNNGVEQYYGETNDLGVVELPVQLLHNNIDELLYTVNVEGAVDNTGTSTKISSINVNPIELKYHTLSFYSGENGDELFRKQIVRDGSSPNKVANAPIEGYAFDFWSETMWDINEDSSTITKFDFNESIIEVKNVYAHATKPTVNIYDTYLPTDIGGNKDTTNPVAFRMPAVTITGFSKGNVLKSFNLELSNIEKVYFYNTNDLTINQAGGANAASDNDGLSTTANLVTVSFKDKVSMAVMENYIRENVVFVPASGKTATIKLMVSDEVISVEGTSTIAQSQCNDTSWSEITSSNSGITLNGGKYYIKDNVTITGAAIVNNDTDPHPGITVNGTVYLYIPSGKTLTVKGSDAYNSVPGAAGILLSEGNTLYVYGGGTLIATGGNAGDGFSGNGASYSSNNDVTIKSGSGGKGGSGAGAGIGTNGAEAVDYDNSVTQNTQGTKYDAKAGEQGIDGQDASDMGSLYIADSITLNATGGAAGKGGSGGLSNFVNNKYFFTINRKKVEKEIKSGICGGGGGGAGGQAGASVGRGGGSGGQGGSGAIGSVGEVNSFVETDPQDGGGGYGAKGTTTEQSGGDGYGKESPDAEGGKAGTSGAIGLKTEYGPSSNIPTDVKDTIAFKVASEQTEEISYNVVTATDITVPGYDNLQDNEQFVGWKVEEYGQTFETASVNNPLTTAENTIYPANSTLTIQDGTYGKIVMAPVIIPIPANAARDSLTLTTTNLESSNICEYTLNITKNGNPADLGTFVFNGSDGKQYKVKSGNKLGTYTLTLAEDITISSIDAIDLGITEINFSSDTDGTMQADFSSMEVEVIGKIVDEVKVKDSSNTFMLSYDDSLSANGSMIYTYLTQTSNDSNKYTIIIDGEEIPTTKAEFKTRKTVKYSTIDVSVNTNVSDSLNLYLKDTNGKTILLDKKDSLYSAIAVSDSKEYTLFINDYETTTKVTLDQLNIEDAVHYYEINIVSNVDGEEHETNHVISVNDKMVLSSDSIHFKAIVLTNECEIKSNNEVVTSITPSTELVNPIIINYYTVDYVLGENCTGTLPIDDNLYLSGQKVTVLSLDNLSTSVENNYVAAWELEDAYYNENDIVTITNIPITFISYVKKDDLIIKYKDHYGDVGTVNNLPLTNIVVNEWPNLKTSYKITDTTNSENEITCYLTGWKLDVYSTNKVYRTGETTDFTPLDLLKNKQPDETITATFNAVYSMNKNPFEVYGTYTYDGEAKTPQLSNNYGLTENDYDIVFGEGIDHTSAGDDVPFKVVLKGNYCGEFSMDFDIGKKQLEVTGTEVVLSKTYDGELSASFKDNKKGTLSNLVQGDVVVLDASASYDNSSVGTNKTITVVYTIDGEDATNYIKPINSTFTGEITKATQTSVSSSKYEGTYDGNPHTITVSQTGGTVTYSLEENGTYSETVPTFTDITNGSTVYFKVSKENYEDFKGSNTVTITQAPLTLSLIEDQVYTGNEIKPTITINGLVTGETLTLGTDYTVSYTDNINVGTATATVTLLDTPKANNYKFNEVANKVTFNITRKPIAVPTANTGLVYTGEILTGVEEGTGYTLSNNTATNANNYIAIAILDNNHKWENEDSLVDKEIHWIIDKANQDAPDVNVGYTLNYFDETLVALEGYEISSTRTDVVTPLTNNKVEPGATYYIRKLGDDNHYISDYSEIVLPNRPGVVTGVEAHQETIMKKDDASLRGVTGGMEYSMSIDNGEYGQWFTGTGYSIGMTFDSNPPISKRDVKVRYKATGSNFKGEETTYNFIPSTNKITVIFFEEESQEVAYGDRLVKPNNPTKDDYTFGGWYMDTNYKEAWNFASDIVTEEITLYPKWIADSVDSTIISGNVTEENVGIVPNATVELYLGTVKVAATKTDENGRYVFDKVENGTYNIVITKVDGKTKTELVTIDTTSGNITVDVELPFGSVNSKIEFIEEEIENAKSDISQAVVGGLDEIANAKAENGKTITIKLQVKPMNEQETPNATVIKQKAGSGKKIEFIDMSLFKQVNTEEPESIGDTNDKLLTIIIPFDFTNIDVNSVMVLRHHGTSEKLTKNPTSDEEGYKVDKDAGTITVYAKKFSSYAIAYDNINDSPIPGSKDTPRYYIPNTGVEGTNNHSLLKLSSLSLLAIGTYMVIKKKKDND